eukprot:SAG11_NODE_21081_length_432_cov_1.429429_1_plen_31_part_01
MINRPIGQDHGPCPDLDCETSASRGRDLGRD